ncbi:hypothetical protein [Carnobacterium funditum]|uniref:hypothetical protein n=1 Tax=Carnobacterium funditum TaxID=2752 RepID=UPI00055660D7|nr:hypothetical protein [Carnobacterium funditum]
MAIVAFVLIGWILSLFKFEQLVIQAFKELFNKEISKSTYYFLFFCIGIFGDLILLFQGAYYVYFLN